MFRNYSNRGYRHVLFCFAVMKSMHSKLHAFMSWGKAPAVRISIDNVDQGTFLLSADPGTDYDSAGRLRGADTTLTFQLDHLNVGSITVAMESTSSVGDLVHIEAITIDSTSSITLKRETSLTYVPQLGEVRTDKSLGSVELDYGSKVLITPTADSTYADSLQNEPGSAANPITIDGSDGFDTAYALGSPSQYSSITQTAGTIALRENSGLHQNADLTNVERVTFVDGSYFQDGTLTLYKPADIYHEPDSSGGGSGNAGVILAGVGTIGLLAFFVL